MLVMEDSEMDRVKLSDPVRKEILHHLSAYTLPPHSNTACAALSILESNIAPPSPDSSLNDADGGA